MDNKKKTGLNLYYVEISFIRPYQEQGIFPCAAESAEAAKKHMEELFTSAGKLENVVIHRVIDSKDSPELGKLIPHNHVEDADEPIKGEDKPEKEEEPTLN